MIEKVLKLPILVAMLAMGPVAAHAELTLLIEEAVGGAGEFTGSGHTAVYFSGLCAETPIQLRLCELGEEGAVVSTYPDLGTVKPYKWLALPLTAFLYGVDSREEVPLYGNGKVRRYLRESYRKQHLSNVVPATPDGKIPAGRWSEMLATAINRDVYALTVKTTPEQDAKFLSDFQKLPNVNDFSTMYNNCADFARDTLNLAFPSATHRDVLNDFTMTTPKAIARTFTRYATSRPALAFHMDKYSQVDGAIRRSLNNRSFTEKAIVSKKYFLTMAFTMPELIPIMGVTYLTTGWYNLDPQYKKHASAAIADSNIPGSHLEVLRAVNYFVAPSATETTRRESRVRKEQYRKSLFGPEELWKDYRKQFEPMLAKALEQGMFIDEAEVKTFFKDLELQSEPGSDPDGRLILTVDDRGIQETVGITRSNINASASSRRLAYKIMLAKVNSVLQAPSRNRPSRPEFEQDWQLLQELSKDVPAYAFAGQDRGSVPRFRQTPEVVSNKKKAQKLLMTITH